MAKSNLVVVREPFVKLVKLVASAFYDNYTLESDKLQKSARSDNRGIAIVVLQTLTRRQWVREEDLAKDLKLAPKQLRKILRNFEEQKLIMRVDRKEVLAATTSGRAEDKVKVQMHSYWCLDYSQIYDVVRYKLHLMKKKFKDELEDKDTVQEYGCLKCKKKLISMEDDSFHCEKCNGELVMECNKLTSEVVDGDDKTRRQQREHLKALLQNMEAQFKPLTDHINRIKDLPVPSFESFLAWEARAAKAAREKGNLNRDDPSMSQGGYGSTPMPFLGETEVEVNLGEREEAVKSEDRDPSVKVFPSWLIKKGMNLTEEQRGVMRQESKVDHEGESGEAAELSDDKKPAMGNGDDDKDPKDEYVKALYAAILEQQELAEKLKQQESAAKLTTDIELATSTSFDRQVGMKCKREEEDDEEEDVEWNEVAPASAEALGAEEEDEDVDWQEG
ncbi:hypothetical protein CARUB_v10007312mg [Capsella rubella]|uniref:HTH TFE/IIEalpha-type domain-containing protein n=1 Tax=Capsella rubella TaxID=81985 RepID=R0H237_9BRAS|nr:hypothetical protein CARUB_v10007312mg [Capsella rubella]